ncbi:MAG TPA: PKD domain-containing protein, partial [Candidatus Hydrogenedentes bacterium]|nr:PKD domain-containing protein [Candidatus Hydrogenedentota bacterium]
MSRFSGSLLLTGVVFLGLCLTGCPEWFTPAGGEKIVLPSAAFRATPTTGTPPLEVQFFDQSEPGSSPISKWEWDFGDGMQGSQRNPLHTYLYPGLYTVSLRVTTAVGSDTERKTACVNISQMVTGPTARFSANPTSGGAPLPVSFNDESLQGTSKIDSWQWSFGDGTTSIEQNPQHTYTAPGVFTVSLTVTTADGTDTLAKSGLISVVVAPDADFSADRTRIERGEIVTFTDLSEPGTSPITRWLWDFGDGATDERRNPTHLYNTWGVLDVSLTVTTADGQDKTTKKSYITVFALPEADFSVSNPTPAIGEAVQFTDLSDAGSAPITSWVWDFGDGYQGTAQNPVHTYTVGGSYGVSLTIKTSEGADSEVREDFIEVVVPPIADFVADPLVALVNTTVVRFTDRSSAGTGAISRWEWSFGDGGASDDPGPVNHVYTQPGTYTVSLSVTTDYGTDTATRRNYVRAVIPPNAAFTASPTSVFAGNEVSFSDNSTPGTDAITSWLWDFGDGSTSTLQHPKHEYAISGKFSVTLTVTAGPVTDVATIPNYITVAALPTAQFSADSLQPLVGDAVQFTDASEPGSAAITSWLWDFGDGGTSTQQNPQHSYALAGRYTVKLTVTSTVGSDVEEKTNYIQAFDPLKADFTVFGVSPAVEQVVSKQGAEVKFVNRSTTGYAAAEDVEWAWDFGDGGLSIEQNPNHVYTRSGLYTVRLTVITPEGTNALTKTDYILVVVYPTAEFEASPVGANVNSSIQFLDRSTPGSGTIVSWQWDFGDGTPMGTGSTVSHAYGSPGKYTVTLTVTTDQGASDTESKTEYISVYRPPTAAFTASNTTPWIQTDEVLFINASDLGDATDAQATWAWDFGDGSTSTQRTPAGHVYQNEGVYSVSLTVTTPYGTSTSTRTDYITASLQPPTAGFYVDGFAQDATQVQIGLGEFAQFVDTSTGGLGALNKWEWDFGDSTTSTQRHPRKSYVSVGTYSVTLKVSTDQGASATITKPDYIQVVTKSPVADFSISDVTPYRWETVDFVDQSNPGTGGITAWTWKFYAWASSGGVFDWYPINEVDINTSTGQLEWKGGPISDPLGKFSTNARNTSFLYMYWGLYKTSLTVTSPYGTSVAEKELAVMNVYPEANFQAEVNGKDRLVVLAGIDDVELQDLSSIVGVGYIWRRWWGIDQEGEFIVNDAHWQWGPKAADSQLLMPEDNYDYPFHTAGLHSVTVCVTASSLEDPGDPTLFKYDDFLIYNRTWSGDCYARDMLLESVEPAPLDWFLHGYRRGLGEWEDWGEDPHYTYTKRADSISGDGFTAYVLDMTSQQWRSADEVYPNLWRHWLTLIVPTVKTNDTVLLFLDDGEITDPAPTQDDFMGSATDDGEDGSLVFARDFAMESGSMVAVLQGTLNQPLVFADKPDDPLHGDDIIAYSFAKFFDYPEPPNANFTADVRYGEPSLTVKFTDTSTVSDPVLDRRWFFGDGSSSTAENPTHVYTRAGNYEVRLTVTTRSGTDTEIKSQYILVIAAGTQPGPNGAFYTVAPALPGSPDRSRFSDAFNESLVFDSFATGSQGISQIYWWGFNLDSSTRPLVPCERVDDRYTIRFYADNGGKPAASPTYTVSVKPTRSNTGLVYDSWPLYRYWVKLDGPITMTNGWLSIQGEDEGSCAFRWAGTEQGDGHCYASWVEVPEVTRYDGYDLSFSLVPEESDTASSESSEVSEWYEPNWPGAFRWPALYPMVRSAVRAMDTIEDFLSNPAAGGFDSAIQADGFVVAGGGNCGWATWLAGVADQRVKGIIPMAWDGLQLAQQLDDQYEGLNGAYFEAWDPFVMPEPLGYDIPSRVGESYLDLDFDFYHDVKKARKFLEAIHMEIDSDLQYTNRDDTAHIDDLNELLDPEEPAYDVTDVFAALIGYPGMYEMYQLIGKNDTGYEGTILYDINHLPTEPRDYIYFLVHGDIQYQDAYPYGHLGRLIKALKGLEDDIMRDFAATWFFYLVDPVYYNRADTQMTKWWWEYGSRLKMPKLILNSAGDQYFMPDSSRAYFGYVDQPKALRYYPNTDHSLNGGYHNTLHDALPWYDNLLNRNGEPKDFTWTFYGDERLEVKTRVVSALSELPIEVALWRATTRDRDFRYADIEDHEKIEWNKFVLQPVQANKYVVQVSPDLTDFTAYFIELTYADGQVFTTDVAIVDPTTPFQDVPPKAYFVADKTEAWTTEAVKFSDLSTQGSCPITAWEWTARIVGQPESAAFVFSRVSEPSFKFPFPGAYTITLKVTAADCTEAIPPAMALTDAYTRIAYLTVSEARLVCDFTADKTTAYVNDVVTFTNACLPGADGSPIVAYAWDFGDGGTASEPNPAHQYTATGVYTVTLTITAENGNSEVSIKPAYVTVTPPPPVVNFTANNREVLAGQAVRFSDLSQRGLDNSPLVNWRYDFGDGTTAEERNPSHTYALGGTYDVTLTVSSESGGRGVKEKVRYIHVTVTGQNLSAALADYVESDAFDPSQYQVRLLSDPGDGYVVHVIEMTSQYWRTAAEVQPNQWKHWMTVVEPNT